MTNFESTNGKSLDLHLIIWFMLKELFPGSTDFTVAIFKIPQMSKHFSAMLHADPIHKFTCDYYTFMINFENYTTSSSEKLVPSIISRYSGVL